MSVQLGLDHLSDRDLLIRVVGACDHMSGEITALKMDLAELNGTVASVSRDQFFQRGALAMLSFILIISLSAAGVVAAVFM